MADGDGTAPSSLVFFYSSSSAHLERVDALALLVERVHQVHLEGEEEGRKERGSGAKNKGEAKRRE